MTNLIISGILLIILGACAYYIYKSKKSGAKCIGCPYAKECGNKTCNCEK